MVILNRINSRYTRIIHCETVQPLPPELGDLIGEATQVETPTPARAHPPHLCLTLTETLGGHAWKRKVSMNGITL